MANNKIDNEIFGTILRIRKNNRADLDNIYKEIKKIYILKMLPKNFLTIESIR